MTTTIHCDSCGTKILNDRLGYMNIHRNYDGDIQKDLCPTCVILLIQWIDHQWIDQGPTP